MPFSTASKGLASLEDRGRTLAEAVFTKDEVLAYRGGIDAGAMVDALVAMHEELNDRLFLDSSPNIKEFVERYRGSVKGIKSWRLSRQDFEFVRTLARGQFGIVDIVKSKNGDGVFAMKTLNKQALLSQREQAAFLEERDVLVKGRSSPWIPDLHSAFQDKESLYLVMEFVAGGDLFSMLDRCENAVIDEDAARFYAAELVLALEDLHRIGYIHRDCKPQNTLLDARGHVKLADFGSCARIGASAAHEAQTSVPVGTCDYIAPETLRAREQTSSGSLSEACDWWSVGAVLYEMIYGDPPFYSDSIPETYAKIMACERHLAFDPDVQVSDDAKDLMRRLLIQQEDRLSLAEIKRHPFFANLDWNHVREMEAPFVPHISSPDDTSNFSVGDEAEEEEIAAVAIAARASSSRLGHGRGYAGEQLPFIGFTYLPTQLSFSRYNQPRGGRSRPDSVVTTVNSNNSSQIRDLREKVDQLETARTKWIEERRGLLAERRVLEDRVEHFECATITSSTPVPREVKPAVRDSAIQTVVVAEEEEKDNVLSKTALATALAPHFVRQSDQMAKLAMSINDLASATAEYLQPQFMVHRKELAQLSQTINSMLSNGGSLASPPMPQVPSTPVNSLATTTANVSPIPIKAAHGSSPSRVRSIATTGASVGRTPSNESLQHKAVVATLVNDANSTTTSSSRLSRAERRVSTGVVHNEALSLVGAKCDRLASMLEQQASQIERLHTTQSAVLTACDALKANSTKETSQQQLEDNEKSLRGSSRSSRRKTEQLRRHQQQHKRGGLLGAIGEDEEDEYENAKSAAAQHLEALKLYRAAADETAAQLRSQLRESQESQKAAESRATELLAWIGRESKGRALLEDMIRTAQSACKMAEEKLESMMRDSDKLKAELASKDEEIGGLKETVEGRDKELRNLRRASRKALDQLTDLKHSQLASQKTVTESSQESERTIQGLNTELQEAAALHVKLQFEIARLEGEVSRLESEKNQATKDLAARDRRIKEMQQNISEDDGIRVRPMEEANTEDEEFAKKFGSIGTKSHKRFKVQLQNMQKHIEYLESKLALAVSENEKLRVNGSQLPKFERSGPSSAETDKRKPNGPRSTRPLNGMFPHLHSNLGSSTSVNQPQQTSGSGEKEDARQTTNRNGSFSSSFERRIRSPFRGFKKSFT